MVRQGADGDGALLGDNRVSSTDGDLMSRAFRLGGIIAGVVLVVFGAGAIVIGFAGRHEVSTDVKRENIVGTPT
jgi:hypothetical protein